MADERPIPSAAFEEALEGLDAEALAALVGELRAAAGEEVAVDGPVVTVGAGDDRIRLRAVPAGGELPADTADVDAVVTAEAVTDRPDVTAGTRRVVGPASLRQRLLYGLDSQAADRLCQRVLGMPARSTHYAPAGSGTSAGGDTARGETGHADVGSQSANEGGQSEGRDGPAGRGRSTGGGGPATGGPSTGGGGPAAGGPSAADAVESGTAPGPQPEGGTDGPSVQDERVLASLADSPWAVVVAVAILALAAGGGAVLVADAGPGGDGTAADGESIDLDDDGTEAEMNPPTDGGRPAPVPENTPTPAATTTASAPATGTAGGSGGGESGSERYADPVPTCNRSYLHVVQVQMNALKYNDDATDDGIRTVRRFASPDNREIVGSFEQFVEIIESPTYAPMLSYDSAAFEPERTGEDTALVRVTTRAAGNVTARYEFRLTRQGEGQYDGCWMTDGVQPIDAGA